MITKQQYEEALSIVNRYNRQQETAPENCYEFNINETVLVKLNNKGYQHWVNSYNILPSKIRPTIESFKERENEQGYVEFQMWDFINIFGSVTGMGFDTYYDTTIRFLKKQIREIK